MQKDNLAVTESSKRTGDGKDEVVNLKERLASDR